MIIFLINFNGEIESKSSFRFGLVYIMRTKNKEQERLKMQKSRGKVDKTRTKRKEGIRCRAQVKGLTEYKRNIICEKVGIKLNIQKTKIMEYSPITSWQIDVERVADFIFGGSKITADGDCSHEIKRRLLLGRKVMTNLDCILKCRDITLPTKVRLVKAMVFPVVMYGCESWTVKKADHRRIDAHELWCWRRLLRVPRTARRSNQSILKEISPGCSLEGLMLKLKFQYFGHLM